MRSTQDTLSKKSEKLDKCEERIKRFEKSIQDEINASVGSIVDKNKELLTQISDLQQENTNKDQEIDKMQNLARKRKTQYEDEIASHEKTKLDLFKQAKLVKHADKKMLV